MNIILCGWLLPLTLCFCFASQHIIFLSIVLHASVQLSFYSLIIINNCRGFQSFWNQGETPSHYPATGEIYICSDEVVTVDGVGTTAVSPVGGGGHVVLFFFVDLHCYINSLFYSYCTRRLPKAICEVIIICIYYIIYILYIYAILGVWYDRA